MPLLSVVNIRKMSKKLTHLNTSRKHGVVWFGLVWIASVWYCLVFWLAVCAQYIAIGPNNFLVRKLQVNSRGKQIQQNKHSIHIYRIKRNGVFYLLLCGLIRTIDNYYWCILASSIQLLSFSFSSPSPSLFDLVMQNCELTLFSTGSSLMNFALPKLICDTVRVVLDQRQTKKMAW